MSMYPRIAYLGIYPPTIARNAVAVKGLRMAGCAVSEHASTGKRWAKYREIAQYVRIAGPSTDVWLVGYLSGVIVPLVRCISKKPIVYNAGNSTYEAVVEDRASIRSGSWRARLIWLRDWFSFVCAHVVLVESEEQKKYIHTVFFVPLHKLRVILTGADNEVFFPDANIAPGPMARVGFRGAFLPATGAGLIVEAAELLRDEPIDIRLYGRGQLLSSIQEKLKYLALEHVSLETRFLHEAELREVLLSCHVILGQFSAHDRLQRTLQNKVFESLALHRAMITLRTKSNEELLEHGKTVYFIETPSAQELAAAIRFLIQSPDLRAEIEKNLAQLYAERASPRAIGLALLNEITSVVRKGESREALE